MTELVHYLLVYNHETDRLERQEKFLDSKEAVAKYSETEHEFADRPRVEVVLIGSDSLETIKKTHGNYFHYVPKSPYLAELLAFEPTAS